MELLGERRVVLVPEHGWIGEFIWNRVGLAHREDMARRFPGCLGIESFFDEQNHIGQILHPSVLTVFPWAGHGVDLLGELLGHIGRFDFEVFESGKGQHGFHR